MRLALTSLLRSAYFAPRMNPWAVRLYRRIHPPPFRTERMEFALDVWNGISSFHAHDGRQIGENNAGPDLFREVIPTEHRACPFGGSRAGREMNVTALRHVMGVWDDTLQFATLLRHRYLAQRGLPPSTRLTLRQAYGYSKCAAAMVAFQARRRDRPLRDGALPALETAFFTLGVGPFMVLRSLLERGDRAALSDAPLTAPQLYDVADGAGTLVSAGGRGCAGSHKLIVAFLDHVMHGTYDRPLVAPDAHRAMAAIGDWDRFVRYLDASTRLELLISLAQLLGTPAVEFLRDRAAGDDATTALLARTLDWMRRTIPTDRPAATVRRDAIAITLALLEDVGEEGLTDELAAAELTGAACQDAESAHRVASRTTGLLHPRCQAAFAALRGALDQPVSRPITRQDMETRTFGPDAHAVMHLIVHGGR